jgi:hypothetical protein
MAVREGVKVFEQREARTALDGGEDLAAALGRIAGDRPRLSPKDRQRPGPRRMGVARSGLMSVWRGCRVERIEGAPIRVRPHRRRLATDTAKPCSQASR